MADETEMQPVGYKALSRNMIIAISVIIGGGLVIGLGVGLGFGLNTVDVTVECEDGFIYRDKCYFASIYPTARIQFQHKESNCSAKGGKVGSILNLEHQILTENYVRPRIPSSSTYTYLWLATVYSNSTETIITSEGHSFPLTSLRWSSDYPDSDSTKTTMLLHVREDKTSESNGVYNYDALPASLTPGVFCEK